MITTHAVDQYILRVRSEWTTAQARTYLERVRWRAVKLPERTRGGEELWDVGDALLVVAPGESIDERRRGIRVARTVLTRQAVEAPGLPADLQAEVDAAMAGGSER